MPLLIAIDISLSNLMPVGPLTNTQKTYFAQLLYTVQYARNIFSLVTFISFPSAHHILCEEALDVGCLIRLCQLGSSQSAFSKAIPAQTSLAGPVDATPGKKELPRSCPWWNQFLIQVERKTCMTFSLAQEAETSGYLVQLISRRACS